MNAIFFYTIWLRPLGRLGQLYCYAEAKEVAATIFEQALENDYKKRLCQLYLIEASFCFYIKENLTAALQNLKKTIEISEEVGDLFSYVLAHVELGNTLGFSCEFEKALKHHQLAMDIIEQGKSKWGMALNKAHQSFSVYNLQGNIDLAYQSSNNSLHLAKESGDILSKAQALTCHGISCYNKRLLADAEKYLLEGIRLCEQSNLHIWNSFGQNWLSEIYYEIGNYEKSKSHCSNAISQLNKIRFTSSWMNLNKIALIRSKVMTNEQDVDLETIYGYISENKIKVSEGWARRLLGDILLNMDENHLPEADKWIRQAIEIDQRNGMMFHLAKDYALYADLFKQKNDIPKAKENLTKAIEILKECGADGWVEKYEKELAGL